MPTGQVLKLYRHKFGFIPVEISGETRPLDIGATLTSGGDTLALSVVNPTWDAVEFPLSVSVKNPSVDTEVWRITSPDDMSTNEPGREPVVKIAGPETVKFSDKLTVGPASITIFRIPTKAK